MYEKNLALETTVYTVSSLNASVKDCLESDFQSVWVEGEISNLVQPASGHWYFSLKDEYATIRCAMFRHANSHVAFPIKNGDAVKVHAKATLYVPRGDYQLVVTRMQAEGQGNLQQQYEALKAKLAELGLFDAAKKRELPRFVSTIAVVTSPTGAVIRDILTTLRRRYPIAKVIVYPSLVQGADAPLQLCQALETAYSHKKADVVILARGGGSLEDLWAFNDEALAHVIAKSPVPIVSAVGHETDFSIADFAADMRAPTPTAAAELVSEDCDNLYELVEQLKEQLQSAIQDICDTHAQHIDTLIHRLRMQHPQQQLQAQSLRLTQLRHRLQQAIKYCQQRQRQQFGLLINQLDAISPLKTLGRGYSIVTNAQGAVITQAAQVQTKEQLTIQVASGKILTEVMSTQ